MTILKTDALTLRAIDYSETSQIVWFFTREHGRVHLIAKGARRPRSHFDGGLEPLVRGEILFYRKPRRTAADEEALEILKEFDARDAYTGARRELGRLYRATYVVELLRELSMPDEAQPLLFDAAVATLETFARGEPRVFDAVLAAFELRALRETGFEPALDRCVECDEPESDGSGRAWFGPLAGGYLCARHRGQDAHAFEVARPALRALAHLALPERPKGRLAYGPDVVHEGRRILDAFIAHRLGKELILPRYVSMVC